MKSLPCKVGRHVGRQIPRSSTGPNHERGDSKPSHVPEFPQFRYRQSHNGRQRADHDVNTLRANTPLDNPLRLLGQILDCPKKELGLPPYTGSSRVFENLFSLKESAERMPGLAEIRWGTNGCLFSGTTVRLIYLALMVLICVTP